MSDNKARNDRRGKTRAGAGRTPDIATLRRKLARSRAKGLPKDLEARGRRVLDAYLGALESRDVPTDAVLSELASGEAARKLAEMTGQELRAQQPAILASAACGAGCAYCCILLDGDGGLITDAEAQRLHAALGPVAGAADGRDWHPRACPALDPATQNCRAYDARPTVCRSFLSTDVEACRTNAAGGSADGSGMLGNHLDYLAVIALSRDLLKGTRRVATYSLENLAKAAVEGLPLDEALSAARHKSAELEHTCRDIGRS
jgi:hypothetical protein